MQDRGQLNLRNRQVVTVNGRKALGQSAIEKDQVTHQSGDGLEDKETTGLPLCQAGCVIHDKEEIAGIDKDTGQLLCAKHAQTECASCHELVGPRSQVRLFGAVYCREHGHRLILLWGGAALAVVVTLLLALRGCNGVYL